MLRSPREVCDDFHCGIRCLELGYVGAGHCNPKGKCVCGTTIKENTRRAGHIFENRFRLE